jgi:DNA-binding CsgD family transcriptional regulator
LIERGKNDCEFFQFGSSKKDHKILEYYLNNLDLLKLFIFYFKDKFFRIIARLANQRILIPPEPKQESTIITLESDQFKSEIFHKINRFYLSNDTYLTKKEVECLKWLASGKSAEEIAVIISCSKRTVEKHIEIMKEKLDCTKQSQLIQYGLKKCII